MMDDLIKEPGSDLIRCDLGSLIRKKMVQECEGLLVELVKEQHELQLIAKEQYQLLSIVKEQYRRLLIDEDRKSPVVQKLVLIEGGLDDEV
jgi:hypothetical protein